MKVIECPSVYWQADNDVSLFIGGGISNCPDWQREFITRFKDVPDSLTLINPRRSHFDINNTAESEFQIEWEHHHLANADAVVFWFPYQTLCPITLYELGVHAALDKHLFVGCHPAYARKFDVEKQLSLIRPDVTVYDNWEPLVDDIRDWHDSIVNGLT